MLNIINPSLLASTSPTHSTRPPPPPLLPSRFFIMKHTRKPAQKEFPAPALSPPRRATPCLARSSQAGSTTLGPSIPMPPLHPCTPIPSIISALPPGPRHVPTKAASQRKEKAEKERRILAKVPSIVAGPASPRLVSPKNTPSSPRKQQAHSLGDGTGAVLLSKAV